MLQLTNETFRENKDNQIDMYSFKYGEANYFVAYLKKDNQQKINPEKYGYISILK
ncbi:hypothetical protein [Massilimicrobiota sp. SW1139]|uniref:hypothetical protein n=1 Tax=Massilimicrobiota sp. SW1139 TaxID=2530043 RepID=UPI00143A2690|nr:hypothetical protein [Massilimicrobiota sp. SW1139]